MPQYGRPEQDTFIGNYQNNANGTTNIWNTIDEDSGNLNDSDYIQSPTSPANQVYVCKLSNMTNPNNTTGHTVRWRAGKSVGSGGEVLDLKTQLMLNYNNEISQGTQIFFQNNNNIADTMSNYSYNLNAAEVTAITDYTKLYLRFTFNKP